MSPFYFMKRILFILSMLIGVAYGQVTGHFRFDSTMLYKNGGNNELILLNGSRAITGGVLTNMGNGRTAFVTPAATTKAKSGTTLSGDTVILGGTTLDRYSAIGLNGFPLSIINNSVDTTTQSDSNSLRLFNRALATSATSAKVSPRFQLGFQGWKTSGGASSVPMWFGWDAYGRSVNPGGGGILRLQSSSNGTIRTLYTITEAGQFQQSLISNGRYFGFAGTGDVIGGSSLSLANSSGSFNVAISNAMANSAGVTGDRNMGAGSASLSLLTSGSFNNAYGYGSLEVNTSGSLNTAVGYNAMKANTIGEQNAAFGANALTANTTGSKNMAIGTAALEENTTGGFNCAVGHDAGLHNTTGTDNVCLGWLAWAQNITGSYNVGIGNSTGRSITYGRNNIYIGHEAGYLDFAGSNAGQNDTIKYSIALGSNVLIDENYKMILGNDSLIKTHVYGIASGVGTKALRYDPTTKQVFYADTSAGGGATPTWQQVLTAGSTLTGDNTIVNGANTLTVTNNTLANSWGTIFSSSSTAAIATQTMLLSSLTGTNANSSVQSIGIRGDVARDGTGSINYGVYGSASQGATSNTAVWGQATDGVTAIGGLFEASGATNNYAVQLVDGTEGVGKVLTSDATGKASWATPVSATSTTTFTNKRWTARVGSTTSSGTPTINTDNVDIYKLTAQAADITDASTNLTGTPVDGDIFEIQITGTAARAITWGTSFVASTVALPTTTVTTATLTVIFQYYTTSSYGNNKWVCVNSF